MKRTATRIGVWKLKIGDRVQAKAYKSDGTCYRWWSATVEVVHAYKLVLVTPVGHQIEGTDGGWPSENALRVYYWPGKWYSLLEAYAPNGELAEIYVNISSPMEIEDSNLWFTDYELDVRRRPPGEAWLEDEDEFLEAATEYGYSEEFQQACYEVAREALDLANGWVAGGMPTIES
jgi:protein associated with RNAse G/E